MSKPNSLNASEAIAKLQNILAEGTLVISDHCRRVRMRERDVTYADIVSCLNNGKINQPPEWDEQRNNWKYRIEGWDKVGEELTSITVIIEANMEAFVVTIF